MELDVDSRKFSGMNGKVNQYPYIVVNENMSPERKRSTIAHELVHIMFSDKNCSEEAEKEKRATAVAGAFLISIDDVHRELGSHIDLRRIRYIHVSSGKARCFGRDYIIQFGEELLYSSKQSRISNE